MGNSQSNMSHDLCDWCVAEDLRSARGIPHDYSATQAYLNYLRRNDELGRYQAVDILCRLQDPHYNINDGLYREIPSVPAIHGIEPFALPRERERDIPRLLSRDRPRTRQTTPTRQKER
ncbi:hypothetical protein RRF57_004316 [Xylaria bambusicola]|uniref:Uncharacterized protein n=1 Tax=Xylaria bambusicola TaxID=326684 RepID=A0AAN7UNL8_9PEZI